MMRPGNMRLYASISSKLGVWLCVPFLTLLCVFPVWAQSFLASGDGAKASSTVFLAGSENPSFNIFFRDQMQKALPGNIKLLNYTPEAVSKKKGALVVTLGPSALNDVVQQVSNAPILALAVTESQFAQYQTLDNERISALYLNPPLKRQALLGRQILPQATRVALLAEAGQEQRYHKLAEELSGYGLELRTFTVENPQNLVTTLSRALNFGDFLLGTPNPQIYNRQTIKHILLTTYRHDRILIGPERAFVQAGALASTYTPGDAIAANAATIIEHYVQSGQLPPPATPDSYSVLFNEQVARSLNIPLPDKESVLKALKTNEQPQTGVGNE